MYVVLVDLDEEGWYVEDEANWQTPEKIREVSLANISEVVKSLEQIDLLEQHGRCNGDAYEDDLP